MAAASYQWFGWPGAQMAVTSVNVTHQVLWTHWPHMPGIVDVQNTSFTRQTLSQCVNICSIRCIYVHCRLENEAQMSAQCPGSLATTLPDFPPLYFIQRNEKWPPHVFVVPGVWATQPLTSQCPGGYICYPY